MDTLSINSEEYFDEVKEVRKFFLEKCDSFLYPHINNSTGGPIYYHIKGKAFEHPLFQLNHKYSWREVEEVVTARGLPKTRIRYHSSEEYELEIWNEDDKKKKYTFYAKILDIRIWADFCKEGMYSLKSDHPPILLVKKGYIIGICFQSLYIWKNIYV